MSAANRLEVADRLVRHLPLVFGLLTAGDISFRHAWVLADAVAELLPAEMMAVEAKVVERAPSQTVAQFRRSVRRAVIEAAPEFAAAQHAKAVRARGVRRVAYPDGMAAVVIDLPTLLGLADNSAELVGYGPITAGARWLALRAARR